MSTSHISVGDVEGEPGAEGESHGACSAATSHGGHPSVAPCPPLPHPHGLRGVRANIRLEVFTSAPQSTMENSISLYTQV